jgi:hypothetical protein
MRGVIIGVVRFERSLKAGDIIRIGASTADAVTDEVESTFGEAVNFYIKLR